MTGPLRIPGIKDQRPGVGERLLLPDPRSLASEADEIERLRQALRAAEQENAELLRLIHEQNASLEARVQARTQELLTLNRLISAITSTLGLDQVLSLALGGILVHIPIEAGSLVLLDEAHELAFIKVFPEDIAPVLAPIRLKPGQGIVGWVVEHGQGVIVNDTSCDPRFYPSVDALTGFRTRSVLCVPMFARGQVTGAIELINKRKGPFLPSDQDFLTSIAGSLAMAVENARLYEETRKRLRELEQANRMLVETQNQLIRSEKLASIGQLTAGVTHELSNPLGIILGYAQIALQDIGPDHPLADTLQTIERQALRCKRIISDLLSFARQSEPKAELADVRTIVEEALNVIGHQLTQGRIEVVREFAPGVPAVWVDVGQIQPVFFNIIQNAIHAMPQGGRLTIRIEERAGRVAIAFTDTGIGIPPENLNRIFDPFFTTKEQGKGTGLGLSVSDGIVTRHGGKIEVESQVGAGATFTVLLPAHTLASPFSVPPGGLEPPHPAPEAGALSPELRGLSTT